MALLDVCLTVSMYARLFSCEHLVFMSAQLQPSVDGVD